VDNERDLSWAETEERFAAQQENLYEALGYPATAEGKAFYDECIPSCVDFIQAELDGAGRTKIPRGLDVTLRRLDPQVIAVSALTALILSPAICPNEDCKRPDIETVVKIGGALLGECRRRRREVFTPKKLKSKAGRGRSAFRSSVWGRDEIVRAGGWLQDCITQALPEVFVHDENGLPQILNTAIDRAVAIAREALLRSPVIVACKSPPAPWTGFRQGGYWSEDSQLSVPFVRGHDRKTENTIRFAMTGGQMRPHIEAVNSQQSVPWMVDEFMLDVVKQYGPYYRPITPGAPARRWKKHGNDWSLDTEPDDHLVFQRDIAQADRLAGEEFYTPMNVDKRGRVYGVPFYLNHQRQDWVRCLFRFKHGLPIGVDGIHWLKIYLATTGDFEITLEDGTKSRISKRPHAERIRWVEQNLDNIHAAADRPFENYNWWEQAGRKKKYQFLAACRELSQAVRVGPTFVSYLPIAFDASASGIQHLCAMSRAPEGVLVNLASRECPADVYELVADRVVDRIRERHLNAWAYIQLNFIPFDRRHVKKCVMTYFYNCGHGTMVEGLKKTLKEQVTGGPMAGSCGSSLDSFAAA
jgi:Autographiviridae RNA polymerase